jgi:hypothetical protein
MSQSYEQLLTPLFKAIVGRTGSTVLDIVRKQPSLMKLQNDEGYTPLLFALGELVTHPDEHILAILRFLLQQREIDFSQTTWLRYNTALHLAVAAQNREIVTTVLQRGYQNGLDISATNHKGNTALDFASVIATTRPSENANAIYEIVRVANSGRLYLT